MFGQRMQMEVHTPVTVDNAATVGQHNSLISVNGNPAIAYYDATGFNLNYVRATDASGTTWGAPQAIDITGSVGQYNSMQIVSGNPAISYYDITTSSLKYVRAMDASGAAWATPLTLETTGTIGQYTSLKVISGNPAISYYDGSNGNLKYIRASEATGIAWNSPMVLATTGTTGQFTSMIALGSGDPGVAFYDASKFWPMFVSGSGLCVSTASTISPVECDNYLSPAGNNYSTTGTYFDIIPNMAGCDSTITIQLVINNSNDTLLTPVVCGSYISPLGATLTTSGNYVEILTNMTGCDSTVTIDLIVNNESSSTINPTACGSYLSPEGNTYTVTGTYTDIIPNSEGCDSTITINLTVNNVDVSTSLSGFTISAVTSTATSYQWIDCDNGNSEITGETDQDFVASVDGNYAVVVSENGCTDTSACVNISGIGFDENAQLNFSLYPNPANEICLLKFSAALNDVSITMYDSRSSAVFEETNISGSSFELNLSTIPAGVYMVQIKSSNGISVSKLVIQK
ncbi:MAG: T9SS type A sorting domain-containing protein [Crocinitomicaceae bacterium]|nr:T9SS type A sorting domain-containing protein [Crocinitomicaceae bacterium]